MSEKNIIREESKLGSYTGYRSGTDQRDSSIDRAIPSHSLGVDQIMERRDTQKGVLPEQNIEQSKTDYEILKNDIEKIRKDVAKMATNFAESNQIIVKNFTEDLIKESQALFESAKSSSETLVKSASETSKMAAAKMEGKIQERPFISIVISFLAGLILAKILDRR